MEKGNAIRETATCKVDCPFRLRILRQLPGRTWRLQILHAGHNHGPSHDPVVHSCHRKRSAEVEGTIEELLDDLRPRAVASKVREKYPEINVRPRDISNKRAKLRDERLAGRTPTQTLLEELQSADGPGAFFRYEPEEGPLERLFFCPPRSQALFQRFPDLLLLDATYKTNRYKLPLLHVVGTTCLEGTFAVAFCYLAKEDRAHYEWAIRCLKEALGGSDGTRRLRCVVTDHDRALKNALALHFPGTPQVSCGWHINKNVLKKVQKEWGHRVGASAAEEAAVEATREGFMGAWRAVAYAKTEDEFLRNWRELTSEYAGHAQLVDYLETQWLPCRAEWAMCDVGHTRTFGNLNTSRLEGAHSRLKSYIGESTHDLLSCVDKIQRAVRDEGHRVEAELATALHKVQKAHTREPLFSEVKCKVAPFVLRKVLVEIEKARRAIQREEALEPCSRTFSGTMGAPCSHSIFARLRLQGNNPSPLGMHDFDGHWWLPTVENAPAPPEPGQFDQVMEPRVVDRSRGRPQAGQAASSTHRNLSDWEVEAAERRSACRPGARVSAGAAVTGTVATSTVVTGAARTSTVMTGAATTGVATAGRVTGAATISATTSATTSAAVAGAAVAGATTVAAAGAPLARNQTVEEICPALARLRDWQAAQLRG